LSVAVETQVEPVKIRNSKRRFVVVYTKRGGNEKILFESHKKRVFF